jgi:hypothetical protein
MGNKASQSCCSQSGYPVSKSIVLSAPLSRVWELLLDPENELTFLRLRQEQELGTSGLQCFTERTLVTISRTEKGSIHVGSQWHEVRREPQEAASYVCCCWKRRRSIETMVTVTDMQINAESNCYSISYHLGMPKTKDIDLQNGTFVKNITLRPYRNEGGASVDIAEGGDGKCLAVVTFVFHIDSFYGCLEQFFCSNRVLSMGHNYMCVTCNELQIVAETYSTSTHDTEHEKTEFDSSNETVTVGTGSAIKT